ncbi:IS66 family transposase (plasmid) [Bradyrhizobium sp. CCGUVB1N3]|uniref:IS66 family transposase n=1 Tax=Bradyrhizobium sp. CCGUVB1N3 TaxID=2949629 RepID=UPI0020B232FE|nr:IS66 family transposase [Bradyrhizobium sp. CCGUVB1N3]MCP3477713.1 IS66 family transposase [Bradyrhizobium sp. CCGUVB1N3]MCP3477757.1 IS66 family transposase [Bradyrhizobium sp. CCGUVB1N3]MCP3477844.1 IS66 family transposase [Bradyrhizobium sp. CCGUVB1N3]MCP3477971.1 IS66 family transposase [Bradyrhizobium sp. CCGUVB1N3]
MNRPGEPAVEELMARIAALQAENRQLTERVVRLEEELALARLHRFAPRSEKHIDRLFNEAEQAADEDPADNEDDDVVALPDTGLPATEGATGRKRGRKALPENLPRERVEYDLPDDQKACPCCRHQMHRMGETVSEQLHIEVKAKVLQNVRFKYACRHCDRTDINTPVVTAPMPAQPLPGSIATASTLAFALVHKYVDGTPLYRLAKAFERAGVPVSRGALGHWVIGSSEKHLVRIYDALKLRLRSQTVIHGDETTVQVLKEAGKDPTSTSYMWAYRSGEDSEQPIVLFDYQPGRGQEHPQAFLGDYRGILMSDGYAAWRTLKGATHVGCMAHARRKFVDALKARKKPGGPPAQALKFFDQLYRIERQVRDEKPGDGETQVDYIRRLRQKHSLPVLDALKAWLDAIAPKVVPDTKLEDAVSYTLNQWEYLTRYAKDGSMPIDNNLLERDIRIFACGRKNWLFSATVEGARASAVIYSLMLTCRACRIEPFAWLKHVLAQLPTRPDEADVQDLLPFNFKKLPA